MVAQRPKPPSAGISYNVSKRRHSSGSDAAETSDFDDDEQGVYEVSSPYLNTLRFLDEQYGIRRDGNTLMSVSAAVTADEKGNISVGGTLFEVTRGLWELLARKIVNSDVITKSDLNAYKRILVMTNAHLVGYEPDGDIQICRGVKYAMAISKIFPRTRRRHRSAVRQYWSSFRGSHA